MVPAHADRRRRVLAKGKNAISIRVVNHDGFNPAVTGQMFITYADGQAQRVPFNGLFKLVEGLAPADADRVGFDMLSGKAVEVAKGQPWGGNRNTEHDRLRPTSARRSPRRRAKRLPWRDAVLHGPGSRPG